MSAYVWNIPDEAAGTLQEIFFAQDGRRQNLVLYEIRKVDGFRRCWEAIGSPGDSYHLILAVIICIAFHLRPEYRVAHQRRELRMAAQNYEKAAMALEELARSTDRAGRVGFLTGLSVAGLSDPTDPRMIAHLRNVAASLDRLLTRAAFKDVGGRPRMRAFEGLIRELALVFEDAKSKRATITRDHYRSGGYSGRFWNFVEIVRPIAAAIIEASGAGSLAQPATEVNRGKFIEEVLSKVQNEKTRIASR
jgi:hypothetical protein